MVMVERWHVHSPWFLANYTIAGPRVIMEASELKLLTPEGAVWLTEWFQRRPGVTVVVHPLQMPTDAPSVIEVDDQGFPVGSGPLDSFGLPPEPEKPVEPDHGFPCTVVLSDMGDGLWLAELDEDTMDTLNATEPTPGAALASLGKLLDAKLARLGWAKVQDAIREREAR